MLALLAVSCGEETDGTVPPTTQAPTGTAIPTTAPTTVEGAAPADAGGESPTSTAVSGSAATTRIRDTFGQGGPTEPAADGADGSGCSPGADVLADGIWFGLVTAFEPAQLTFDLACRYSGDRAAAHPDFDGGGSVVVNDSDKLRVVPVNEGTSIWLLDAEGVSGQQVLHDIGSAPSVVADRGFAPAPTVWVLIEQGAVVEVWEPS